MFCCHLQATKPKGKSAKSEFLQIYLNVVDHMFAFWIIYTSRFLTSPQISLSQRALQLEKKTLCFYTLSL